jgi:hypothetical protein
MNGNEDIIKCGTENVAIAEHLTDNATGLWNLSDYGATPNFNAGEKGKIFISRGDKEILLKLADKVAVLALRPTEEEKRKLWKKLNSLQETRPLVLCDPENGWNEILPGSKLRCTGELARRWEIVLRKEIFWGESLLDDKVIEPFFEVGYTHKESNWGFDLIVHGGTDGGSYVWESPIKEEKDIDKIFPPVIEVDYKTTNETIELANETFGDLLKIRLRGRWWWGFGLTFELALLRGLNEIMLDMYDNPKLIHRIMKILSDGFLKKLSFLEENNLLTINNDCYIGSGGFGYTDELPGKNFNNSKVMSENMWGHSESQETVGISTRMFEEFIFPYQLPIQKRFGLNYYGCCEPLDKRWPVIKNIPNLRIVSVSAWTDLPKMADYLEDKYVIARKPSPTPLVLPDLDEELIRKKTREDLEVTKGCRLQFIMKDNNTIGHNPDNVINWVRVVKEEIDRMYG